MKLLYIVFIFSLAYLFLGNIGSEEIVIPDDSIRFRVIANSNTSYDQLVKIKLKQAVENELITLTSKAKTELEVNKIINDNLDELNNIVRRVFSEENYLKPYNISFGENYFPEKELFGVKYKEGIYDSLVITIGDGLGDNWWCVLFPPLCLIEAEESEEVEYYFYVKEVLDKYI